MTRKETKKKKRPRQKLTRIKSNTPRRANTSTPLGLPTVAIKTTKATVIAMAIVTTSEETKKCILPQRAKKSAGATTIMSAAMTTSMTTRMTATMTTTMTTTVTMGPPPRPLVTTTPKNNLPTMQRTVRCAGASWIPRTKNGGSSCCARRSASSASARTTWTIRIPKPRRKRKPKPTRNPPRRPPSHDARSLSASESTSTSSETPSETFESCGRWQKTEKSDRGWIGLGWVGMG
mmetsp:Transcript_21013/g.58429  ORF Transcript_21013/g.58429 Transcript_21013/m.58429 type:complete len:234 (+) Transcript_21013:462-1163(+)